MAVKNLHLEHLEMSVRGFCIKVGTAGEKFCTPGPEHLAFLKGIPHEK